MSGVVVQDQALTADQAVRAVIIRLLAEADRRDADRDHDASRRAQRAAVSLRLDLENLLVGLAAAEEVLAGGADPGDR